MALYSLIQPVNIFVIYSFTYLVQLVNIDNVE